MPQCREGRRFKVRSWGGSSEGQAKMGKFWAQVSRLGGKGMVGVEVGGE